MLLNGSTAIAGRSGSGNGAGAAASARFCQRRGQMRPSDMLVHGANEANALPRNGPDQLLFLAVVADRVPRGVDAAVERRVRHDPAAPYQGDEIVPADDTVAVLQQMNQQVEHLRLHRDQLTATAQLAKARYPAGGYRS